MIAGIVRAGASLAAVALCVGLAACAPGSTGSGAPSSSAGSPSVATPSPTTPAPTPPAGVGPDAAQPEEGGDPPSADADQPVPKVQRPGQASEPVQSAPAASASDPVSYPDGVSVRIAEVSFAEETAEGPGAFPGRAYARLTLELSNGSSAPIDLATSVLTLLDENGPAAPVYADEAEVRDFTGSLAPGRTATAIYAFAVGQGSPVTLVIDFDADHTSAVFRGRLG